MKKHTKLYIPVNQENKLHHAEYKPESIPVVHVKKSYKRFEEKLAIVKDEEDYIYVHSDPYLDNYVNVTIVREGIVESVDPCIIKGKHVDWTEFANQIFQVIFKKPASEAVSSENLAKTEDELNVLQEINDAPCDGDCENCTFPDKEDCQKEQKEFEAFRDSCNFECDTCQYSKLCDGLDEMEDALLDSEQLIVLEENEALQNPIP